MLNFGDCHISKASIQKIIVKVVFPDINDFPGNGNFRNDDFKISPKQDFQKVFCVVSEKNCYFTVYFLLFKRMQHDLVEYTLLYFVYALKLGIQ